MISVDTNIVIRLLTKDDPDQYQQSYTVFSSEEVFVPDTVILETEWVLRYAYGFEPEQIIETFKKLFGLSNVHLRDANGVSLALEWHEKGIDFADALHLAQSQHCREMLTFDRHFVKRSENISSCPIMLPGS